MIGASRASEEVTSNEPMGMGWRARRRHADWWGHAVALDFHFLDPGDVRRELEAAGFTVEATLTRAPHEGVEHASQRAYLLAWRP